MKNKIKFFNRISVRILTVLLALFAIAASVIGIVNNNNIRHLYEKNFTERVLLTNAMMAAVINSEDVEHYANLIKGQDNGFKEKQLAFYYDREELFRLQETNAPKNQQQNLLNRLANFHKEMAALKTDRYWEITNKLRELKEASHSTYVYIMIDTGLMTKEGEKLYTYVFDAEDDIAYHDPLADGLGTCYVAEPYLDDVLSTKRQMEKVEYYMGDYGELYFAYTPILNEKGDTVAALGCDLALENMNIAIIDSSLAFNMVFVVFAVLSVLIIYAVISLIITRPLSRITNAAHDIAQSNLHRSTWEMSLKQQNEIGMLARAINDMHAATTLYLNSIPESLFIMSRDFEMHFKNECFTKCFGDMRADEFVFALFPQDPKEKIAGLLEDENNNTVVWINDLCFSVIVKKNRLSNTDENSILVIAIDITDLINEKENAQAAAEAKSRFLSRMSHEMRTPMNAIIGMSKIAENSDSVSKLKHCLSTISESSEHLLGIINDVLDMSKIEAGKLALENVPVNIEKTIMKVCNIVIDSMEKKGQRFNVVLDSEMTLHYLADELRLSQVLTNLLSNAVKFTPEQGTISLMVDKVAQQENAVALRFSVSDTGIGMTDEQIAHLFNAFEQADGSITRKFGGTGLGLAISKSIVEKMGGQVWIESKLGSGSTFSFEVNLECVDHQDTVIFNGIRPNDIKVLIIESDDDILKRFSAIIENFGIGADTASNHDEAIRLAETAYEKKDAYDIIFLSYDILELNNLDMIKQLNSRIDKNSVVVITTYLEWHQIEEYAGQYGITRYITKPVFSSSVLDMINDVIGTKLKSLEIKIDSTEESSDLSDVSILLAEDVEINREIFLALLEGTHVSVDIAENGNQAVLKFRENPLKYDLIIMDIQMPEMDGYEATKTIRALNLDNAKTIPIVAMTANVFKEDIDRCLECGMNDHLAKPIDEKAVVEKILKYSKRRNNHA